MSRRRKSLFWSFAIGSSLVVVVLLLGLLASHRTLVHVRGELDWIAHKALPLSAKVEEMRLLVVDLENGVRGFVISTDWALLKPFQRARARWPKLVAETRNLVMHRAEDVATLDELDGIIQAWLKDVGQKYIDLGQKLDAGDADMADLQTFVEETDAAKYVPRAQRLLADLAQRTQTRAEERFEDTIDSSRRSNYIVVSTIAFALAAVLLGVAVLARNVAARLANLRSALLEVGEGGRVQTAVAREDEIGDVERAFNRMVGLLDEKNRTIEEKLAELARAYQMKSQFLSTMSHELRTPLNSIIGFSDIVLADGATPDGTRKSVEVVRRNAQHLREIIDDVLDLARLESGRMEVRRAPTDLVALVRTCVATVAPLAQQKNLELGLDGDAPARLAVATDAAKVRQIVLNLLSNAVKFTEQGNVRVGFSRRGAEVILWVADTGIGMPMEALAMIFDEFRQLDAGENRRFGGSGLGLALSRKLARVLGGDLEVTSEPGRGSRFSLCLPADAADAGSEAA